MKSNDFGGVQRNVLGGPLGRCSDRPLTGFFRDGCCNTGPQDLGSHTVCVVMTDDFLVFSKARGNCGFRRERLPAEWHAPAQSRRYRRAVPSRQTHSRGG